MTDPGQIHGLRLLRDYLRREKKTQEQFGHTIGKSQGHVSKILSGEVRVDLDLAFEIERLSNGQVRALDFVHADTRKALEITTAQNCSVA